MSNLVQEKEEAKALIRGLLTSSKHVLTSAALFTDFKNMTGFEVPYRKFGFPNFEAFLRSIPDTVRLQSSGGLSANVLLVTSDKSKHIDELVQKQKPSTTKRKGTKRNSYMRPFGSRPSSLPKPLVPHGLQKRIQEMLLQNPNGIELSQIEKHFWIFNLEQYGGVEALMTQLRHIATIVNGKVYSANHSAPPQVNELPEQNNASTSCTIVPAGYEVNVDRKVQDDWDDISWSADEEATNEVDAKLSETSSKLNHFSDPDAFHTFKTVSNVNVSTEIESNTINYISDKLKNNLQTLVEKYPDGIWCSELPRLYEKHFGAELNVQNLGFVSVVQFVSELPDLFQSIHPTEADWMVFDAKKSIPESYCKTKDKTKQGFVPDYIKRNIKKLSVKFKNGIPSDLLAKEYLNAFGKILDVSEWGFDSIKAFLLSIQYTVITLHFVGHQIIMYPKPGAEEELAMPPVLFSNVEDYLLENYPADVAGPNSFIPIQNLPENLKFCDNIEVMVAEVFTPHKFWVQLRGEDTTVALDTLMTDMQEFYNTEYNDQLYKMTEPVYREKQYCVAPYNDEYHRAYIRKVLPEEVQVQFIDYGTVGKVNKHHMRFLHNDFMSLPAQAIRARLANLEPVEGPDAPWPREASRRFLVLVADKPLVAIVHTVDYEEKSLEIALVDTTGEDDVHINDTLKKEGYADYSRKRRVVCKQNLNPTTPPRQQQKKMEIMAEAKMDLRSTENIASNSRNKSSGLDYLKSKSMESTNNIHRAEAPSARKEKDGKVFSASKEDSDSGKENIAHYFATKYGTGTQKARNENTTLSHPTSSRNQQADDEEPIIISTTKGRVLPPPGFSNSRQNLPSLDPYALMNMALYQQALQQQQQQQVLQTLVMTRPDLFMQGNSRLGPFVTPYAANAIPVIPIIAQPIPVAPMVSAIIPNLTEVPATCTQDSATMTSFEEINIPDSSPASVEVHTNVNKGDVNTSAKEDKNVSQSTAKGYAELQRNAAIEEVDDDILDEDFVYRSDSDEEITITAKELQAQNQLEGNAKKNEQVVMAINYENVNPRQAQPTANQHKEVIIGTECKVRQPNEITQSQITVHVKTVEINKNMVYVVNLKGVPYLCMDELVHVFTNFSGRHVILKILESKSISFPFKELKKQDYPEIFKALESSNVQGLQKRKGVIQSNLHVIPLHNVMQLLTLLKINDAKILRGIHETLESWRTNENFWS